MMNVAEHVFMGLLVMCMLPLGNLDFYTYINAYIHVFFYRAAIVMYMSIPISEFLPPSSIPPWYPYPCSPPVSISGWK